MANAVVVGQVGRTLPSRRPLAVGCAASSDGDARKAGAAAVDAVFRHLDASLDDEDGDGIDYGQGEKKTLGIPCSVEG